MSWPRRTAHLGRSEIPLDRSKLAAARQAVADSERALIARASEIRLARAELVELARQGAASAALKRAERRLDALDKERERVSERRLRDERVADGLAKAVDAESDFESAIGDLDGQVPIALLPVRIETRFTTDLKKLRVRVFPDTVHQDGHEPELTAEEIAAAARYWKARWQKAGVEQDRAAWRELAQAFRPTRARWLAEAVTPTNVATLGAGDPTFPEVAQRPVPWTRAPIARVLPERWLVLGYRGDTEVVRKWGQRLPDDLPMGPAPDLSAEDDPTTDPAANQDVLPIDEEMKWLVDYDLALAKGMAITIDESDVAGGRLDSGFDLLLVTGVDWTREPSDAVAGLEAQLAAHSYSDGLSFFPVGTPTNVTSEEAGGTNSDVQGRPELLDPVAIASVTEDSDGTRLREALGLPSPSVVERIPGAASRLDTAARHMNNALWAPTWGYFLDQMMRPLVDVTTGEDTQDHFRRFVRGRGPFPALRIGKQPYGVLPVMAPDDWKPLRAGLENALNQGVSALRPQWLHSASAVPRLGDQPAPDEVLVDLLRRTPRSETFRFRKATGRAVASGLRGLDAFALFQESFARLLLSLAGIEGRPSIVDVTLADTTEPLPVPFVASGELSEADPLDPNYFRSVLQQLSRSGGFKILVDDPETADSVLEALIRHAAHLEMSRVAFLLITEAELNAGIIARAGPVPKEIEIHIAEPTPGLPPIEQGGPDPVTASILAGPNTVLDLSLRPVGMVSGRKTVANFVAGQSNAALRQRVSTRRFAEFRASLNHLSGLPSAELGRLAAEALDCASHRLDAWVTSLATRRLFEVRSRGSQGIHIGGYGWVEDLRPGGGPTSLGYTLAPSVAQASTAAILRSGHLSRRGSGDTVFAIDLSSERVSLALEILEGVRLGQPIGAILGYRFERDLRERSLPLARYILEFRRAAPLDTSTDGFDDSRSLEAVAARDVVDGIKLVRRAREAETALLDEVGVDAGDRNAVRGELGRLVAALDAVSDVLMSESVYQAVLGNPERSGAALDAIDRQTLIPDVSVVRTPRTGHGMSHRLMIALTDDTVPTSWSNPDDPRGTAEPRLNSWLARAIGDPNFIRIRAVAKDADGKTRGQPLQARLAALELSPMSTVLAAVGGGGGKATELEDRLADHFFGLAPPGAVALEFHPDPPSGSPKSVLGLGELMDLCGSLVDLLGSCRNGSARDLVAATDRVEEGFEGNELRRRADTAVSSLRRARNELPGSDQNPGVPRLRRTLLAMADMGVRDAVPVSASREDLVAQVAEVAAAADELLAALDALEDGLDRASTSVSQQVQHDLARLRMIFGENFPVGPLFRAANGDELTAALTDADVLLDGEPLAATMWLQQHGLVRPAVARLSTALTDVEMRGRDLGADQLEVAQLPRRRGDRWVGLPLADGTPLHVGAASLVIHSVDQLDMSEPLAVWMIDQWSEVIPRRTETAGVSFHFDAPGARAPQSILLAVPPDPTATGWRLANVIGSVREAVELSKMRAVDLDHLEAAGRFLPAIYLAFNLERKTPSLDLWKLASHGIEIENRAFIGEGGG
jgi:hypothetical protein